MYTIFWDNPRTYVHLLFLHLLLGAINLAQVSFVLFCYFFVFVFVFVLFCFFFTFCFFVFWFFLIIIHQMKFFIYFFLYIYKTLNMFQVIYLQDFFLFYLYIFQTYLFTGFLSFSFFFISTCHTNFLHCIYNVLHLNIKRHISVSSVICCFKFLL